VELQIGDKIYTINRRSEKYVKKLKGEVTDEARTDLDFDYYDPVLDESHSLNDTSRIKTDAAIRKHFGTIEDFLLTSMASQLDSLSFIKEGSTRRKEILAKFLDLEVFEKKYKFAKEDSADLKGVLRRVGDRNFEEEIAEVARDIKKTNSQLSEQEDKCENIQEEIKEKERQLEEIEKLLDLIPVDAVNIIEVEQKRLDLNSKLGALTEENEQRTKEIQELRTLVRNVNEFINEFDIDELNKKYELIVLKQEKLDAIVNEAKFLQKDFNIKNLKLRLLDEVPCGDEYSQCKFIRDAHKAKREVAPLQAKIVENIECAKEFKIDLGNLNPKEVSQNRLKHGTLIDQRSVAENKIKDLELLYARTKNKIISFMSDITSLQSKIEKYEDYSESIENFECLTAQRQDILEAVGSLATENKNCQGMVLEYYKLKGSYEQKVSNLIEQQKEFKDIQQEYAAYDLYMRCMHSNGIAYDIIKKQLPFINEEVAKVLANIVNFEIFFEDDGKRLNIFIKHPKHEPRPLEMGSGAEKTIAAMAIRLALLSVSNLPKGDIFILDEPGTALDADNMEGFVRILELIKSYFKTVILISHLDSLKDCVDTQIIIEKIDTYAHVEV
jgi:exonuclease SbcC